jgi:ATP-dependent helicase HrpB
MAYPPAEIEAADLTGLALELALWGAEPADLPLLTQPPAGSLSEARALLQMLGALDGQMRITDHGRALARLPLHPRLAHMLAVAGPESATLAALMADRDPLRGAPVDLALRLEALRDLRRFRDRRPYQVKTPALQAITSEAKRLRRQRGGQSDAAPPAAGQPAAPATSEPLSPAAMAALAYPDRVAQRRKGDDARYVLSGGKGAVLENSDPLAAAPYLVVTDSDGNPREARIRLAAQITLAEIRALFADQIHWQDLCSWSKRDRRVVARKQERFGALVLDDRIWKDVPPEATATAMLDGVRDLGLRLSPAAARLATRVELLRAEGHDLPDFSEAGLMASLEDWLLPMLTGVRTDADWKGFDALPALRAALTWEQTQLLDREVPGSFVTPLGRKIPIDYAGDTPGIEVRLQEMFGVTRHPTVAGVALKVTLLSPARRPIQITRDLPGFWSGSYADVRKDMRAQYPKHPWPEDPTQAEATLRARPRG